MRYTGVDHTFDWRGFKFFSTLGVLFLLLGASVHYGTLYAKPLLSPNTIPTDISVPKEKSLALITFSSTTPKRVINSLTIADAIPANGKFIAVDLVAMKLYLYQDSKQIAAYPLISKGRPGTPWETPSGFYSVQAKEEEHFSTIGKVYMPYSMQFYGNYFIHGETYYPDGTPTGSGFSGGCIRLGTEDAAKVFTFADRGTDVFVYDSKQTVSLSPLQVPSISRPSLQAAAYLVADIDTGDVYAERNAQEQHPIASVTKLMTALVANETISFDKKISVPAGGLKNPPDPTDTEPITFSAEDLLYPLLMQSSNAVAESVAAYYGKGQFLDWMNSTAQSLGMNKTFYADTSGISAENTSTADDLFRLAAYLADKKSFVLNVTHIAEKTITAEDGTSYDIQNVNTPVDVSPFVGGKSGHTNAAQDTMLSVLSFDVGGETRRIAVVVLGSINQIEDTTKLADWIIASAKTKTDTASACVSCAALEYRKIEF